MNKRLDNTKLAKNYKKRWEKSNDTILQRGEEYVKKINIKIFKIRLIKKYIKFVQKQ